MKKKKTVFRCHLVVHLVKECWVLKLKEINLVALPSQRIQHPIKEKRKKKTTKNNQYVEQK